MPFEQALEGEILHTPSAARKRFGPIMVYKPYGHKEDIRAKSQLILTLPAKSITLFNPDLDIDQFKIFPGTGDDEGRALIAIAGGGSRVIKYKGGAFKLIFGHIPALGIDELPPEYVELAEIDEKSFAITLPTWWQLMRKEKPTPAPSAVPFRPTPGRAAAVPTAARIKPTSAA